MRYGPCLRDASNQAVDRSSRLRYRGLPWASPSAGLRLRPLCPECSSLSPTLFSSQALSSHRPRVSPTGVIRFVLGTFLCVSLILLL